MGQGVIDKKAYDTYEHKLLKEVSFFDVYRGAPIPAGKKSVAFSLSFRKEDSSLTDSEIEPVMTAILHALEEKLQAKIR